MRICGVPSSQCVRFQWAGGWEGALGTEEPLGNEGISPKEGKNRKVPALSNPPQSGYCAPARRWGLGIPRKPGDSGWPWQVLPQIHPTYSGGLSLLPPPAPWVWVSSLHAAGTEVFWGQDTHEEDVPRPAPSPLWLDRVWQSWSLPTGDEDCNVISFYFFSYV